MKREYSIMGHFLMILVMTLVNCSSVKAQNIELMLSLPVTSDASIADSKGILINLWDCCRPTEPDVLADQQDNLYIFDFPNYRVRVTIYNKAGKKTNQFYTIYKDYHSHTAVDSQGNIYGPISYWTVSNDRESGIVYEIGKYSRSGKFLYGLGPNGKILNSNRIPCANYKRDLCVSSEKEYKYFKFDRGDTPPQLHVNHQNDELFTMKYETRSFDKEGKFLGVQRGKPNSYAESEKKKDAFSNAFFKKEQAICNDQPANRTLPQNDHRYYYFIKDKTFYVYKETLK